MPISVRCPKCGHGYQLRDELAGKQAKCRCGEVLSIPAATTLSSLLDEEHIGQSPDDAIGEPMPAAAMPTRYKSSPQFGKGIGRSKKRGKDNTVAIVAAVVGGAVVLFVVILAMFLMSGSEDKPLAVAPPPAPAPPPQPTGLPGQTTPEETFESYKQAWIAGDWPRVYALFAPEAQEQMTTVLAMMGASLGPVCPELAAVAKQYGVEPTALAGLSSGNADPFAAEQPAKPAPDSIAAQMQGMGTLIKDKPAFFAAAMPVFLNFLKSDKFAGIAQMGSQASGVSLTSGLDLLPIMSETTTLSDVSENGPTASGIAKTPLPAAQPGAAQPAPGGAEKTTPMKFNQISGSWYIGPAL